jgi:hypothetical protein
VSRVLKYTLIALAALLTATSTLAHFTAPWHLSRTYQRVTHIHRMVYEDCEGEERNPVVNGRFALASPPSSATPPPATAPNSAPPPPAPAPQ